MKIVHHNKRLFTTVAEWFAFAKEQEQKGELEEAAFAYEKVISLAKLNEPAYNRLMIIYRKLKDYKKESAIIRKAINAFETSYNRQAGKSRGKKIAALSKTLMKLTGLADKKGKVLYDPEPLGRWKRRKAVVDKRLKKGSE